MKFKKIILGAIIFVWAITVGLGIFEMSDYTWRAGRSAIPPPKLISEFQVTTNKDLPLLLIFFHPQCPCSRATLAELVRLLNSHENSIEIHIIFYKPASEPDEWVKTNIWRQASTIPGVTISVADENEIKRFGAITSGQTLLYDKEGNLIFSGGITNGRGHEGNNPGEKSIETFLQTNQITVSENPVFGCAITDSE
ncbi:MAG TPA: hypothetical protein PKY82_26425 [Pyrinomonadaceae bacterium]|nr:hypothetical protein [Pyrinomonadaceae bacterium]